MLRLSGTFAEWPKQSQALIGHELTHHLTELPERRDCFIWEQTWGLFAVSSHQTLVIEAKRGLFLVPRSVTAIIRNFETSSHYYRDLVQPFIDRTFTYTYHQSLRRQPFFPLSGAVGLIPLVGGEGTTQSAINPRFFNALDVIADAGLDFQYFRDLSPIGAKRVSPLRRLRYVPTTRFTLTSTLGRVIWLSALIPILTDAITHLLGEASTTGDDTQGNLLNGVAPGIVTTYLRNNKERFMAELDDSLDQSERAAVDVAYDTVLMPRVPRIISDPDWAAESKADFLLYVQTLQHYRTALSTNAFRQYYRKLPPSKSKRVRF